MIRAILIAAITVLFLACFAYTYQVIERTADWMMNQPLPPTPMTRGYLESVAMFYKVSTASLALIALAFLVALITLILESTFIEVRA